jgi:hypothetical protein
MRATADVIGELAAAVLAEGGSVRTLRAARELSGQLTACTLRYALPAAGRRHALR